MILLYHKVDVESKTEWWISVNNFYRQMVQLRGKKVVYLDDYNPKNPDHVVITFDGVYTNVLRYAAPILKKFGYPFELFITGDWVGKKNEFDTVEPPCDFADTKTLQKLMEYGGRLQWHTKTHRKITTVADKEVEPEITTPDKYKKIDPKGFKWYGYAHGEFDDRSKALVKKQYKGGLACENGNYSDKTIWPRRIIREGDNLIDEKVSILIPSYNYGHFLVEAIESVLKQTYLPDEIILSDDASTDHTYDIMRVYAEKYPDLVKLNHNDKNLGIQKHFNKIVKMSSGDLLCLLGADNRMPSDYIEKSVEVLCANPKTGVVYNDFALFGGRASEIYENWFEPSQKGEKLSNGVYLIHFPEFTPKTKKHLLTVGNFIHGSSMYRRKAYDDVGGYIDRSQEAEDHSLFKGMVKKGWLAQKVPHLYLEYRQHSVEQANLQFAYFGELAFLRQQFSDNKQKQDSMQGEINALHEEVHALHKHIQNLTSSKAWKASRRMQQAKYAALHPKAIPKKANEIIRRYRQK